MPNPTLGLAHHYRAIAHFHGVDPLETWRSSFEYVQTSAVPAPADAILVAMQNYWLANLRNDCTLDTIEVRNWTFGPQPFSQQQALFHKAIGNVGSKTVGYGAMGANAVGKEVAAYIRYSNTGPKNGKAFLRQLLDDGDIAAVPGSPWVFLQAPQVPNVTPAKFTTVFNSTSLSTYIGAVDPGLRVVHFSLKKYLVDNTQLPFPSTILAVSLIGPTVNKATRKNKR
jgi:hypothetical protein